MDKQTDDANLKAAIHTHMEAAIAEMDGMCASVALRVLGGLFNTGIDDATLATGLGIRFSDALGAARCAFTGTALFISSIAKSHGSKNKDIISLGKSWQRLYEESINDLQILTDGLGAATDIFVAACHFIAENQEILGLRQGVVKPKQYYDSIFTDRESMFKHSPYALEEKLTRAVTKGDEVLALAVLREINAFGEKAILARNPLRSVKNSMIGSIAFLARAAIQAGVSANDAFALSDVLTLQVEEMGTRGTVLAFEEKILMQFIALVRQRLEASYSSTVVKVMHYVENHLDTRIHLNEAAAYASVHPSYLSMRFKKETGLPFTGYVAMRKIQESSYFIRYTNYSVSQIAFLYGFSSQSYYISTFKKVMGTTPVEYRRRILSE